MKRFKKKIVLMCTIALICAGVLCFNSCTSEQIVWGIFDGLTFGSITFATEEVEEGETKEATHNFINGIAGAIEGISNAWQWIMGVVSPQ